MGAEAYLFYCFSITVSDRNSRPNLVFWKAQSDLKALHTHCSPAAAASSPGGRRARKNTVCNMPPEDPLHSHPSRGSSLS